jgi:hypothetical protein
VPLKDLHAEEGTEDLATSPEMEAYLRLAMAEVQGADLGPELETLRRLPLEKRYIWRVASALRWAFADFDSQNIAADKETLTAEDQAKVMNLMKHRPLQLRLFLKALLGPEEMKRVNASLMKRANVDPKAGADQRGHGIGVSLDVYTQSDREEKRAAVNTLEADLA